jgi:U3 small nucleolar RNA-associated protein 12
MVNEYFQHNPTDSFGLIHHSPQSTANALYLSNHLCLAPALEDVFVWDLKTGTKVAEWHVIGFRSLVSCMALSATSKEVAVGYQDGSIRIWDVQKNEVKVTLDGHRKSVSALRFDATGQRLASGSQDTDIVIWDVLLEQGLFK